MKRTVLATMAAACLACTVALPSLHAVDVPADGAKIDFIDGGDKNLVVIFNHSTHKDVKCEDCHHMPGEKQYAGCTTDGCHNILDKADKSVNSWYKVIHDAKAETKPTCISCHKDLAGEDKDLKKKLTGCKGSACHPG
ncbi:MAG: cytochrome c3 family protein [Desulfovibrio sp.]|nr:cytochrome c3 family protein [Desulfovibrio sp.]MCA1986323.1 cytochrome c3 family protein [Desulfovibrio sp.]